MLFSLKIRAAAGKRLLLFRFHSTMIISFFFAPNKLFRGGNPELASYFVVYRFNDKEPIDTSDPSKIVAITRETGYLMPYEKGKVKYRYVVTAVDRFHNESEGKTKKVKL